MTSAVSYIPFQDQAQNPPVDRMGNVEQMTLLLKDALPSYRGFISLPEYGTVPYKTVLSRVISLLQAQDPTIPRERDQALALIRKVERLSSAIRSSDDSVVGIAYHCLGECCSCCPLTAPCKSSYIEKWMKPDFQVVYEIRYTPPEPQEME